ncbi:YggL family protein [Vibrio sp. SCSIO 43136]|uniref:YggL family protein n=1 Tax=Vibrio sp. SCSIO 43136 TaxID=2819101 RepID=UPI002076355F|nr:YggL family protein [Vibrio sp. SCSIO 43136]USD67681.1 YggL family protein [Vibrio sp. SCSIO 43136]
MKLHRTDNKKPRLLKKLYLGEYALKGVEVSCQTSLVDFDTYEAFFDAFADFLESHNMEFAGGGLEEFQGFICPSTRYGSLTTEQITLIQQWLNDRSEVSHVEVSELLDANYF